MNEHIQTGIILKRSYVTPDEEPDEQWVPLKWLKEQIQKNTEQVFEKKTEDWIPVIRIPVLYSLLEEKP